MDLHPWIVVPILVAVGIYRLLTFPMSQDDPRSLGYTIIFVVAGSIGYIVLYSLLRDKSGLGDVLILATAIGLIIWMVAGYLVKRDNPDA